MAKKKRRTNTKRPTVETYTKVNRQTGQEIPGQELPGQATPKNERKRQRRQPGPEFPKLPLSKTRPAKVNWRK